MPVRVLERDPELGLRLPVSMIGAARAGLVANSATFEAGLWEPPSELCEPGGMGFLVLDGILSRELILAGTTSAELLGEGDLVQSQPTAPDDGLVGYHVQWHVLEPLTVAILDESFSRMLGAWPQVTNCLLEREMRRTQRLAVKQALLQLSPVETRLLVLFWHLSERWGRVSPEGILLQLRLPHELLGHLVGCQRASVTTALARVTESGRVRRRDDGRWLLSGPPPGELFHVHWQQRHAAENGRVRTGPRVSPS